MTKETESATQQIRKSLRMIYDTAWDRLDIIWAEDVCLPQKIGPFLLVYSPSLQDFGGVSIQGLRKAIAKGYGHAAESEHLEYLPQPKEGLGGFSDLLKYVGRTMIHKAWEPHMHFCIRGQSLECTWENEPDYTDWINHDFEVRRAIDEGVMPGRILGCRINGIMSYTKLK